MLKGKKIILSTMLSFTEPLTGISNVMFSLKYPNQLFKYSDVLITRLHKIFVNIEISV